MIWGKTCLLYTSAFFKDKEIQNLVIINPDNPTGNYLSHKDLQDLILINKSQTQYDGRATLVINDAIGKVLGD